MYQEHPSFKEPSRSNIKLWRYLDFTKFVSLIDKRALFFVRSDKLEDTFEGAITKKMSAYRKSTGGYKRVFLINSWHMNEYESAAMWKLYLKSEEGVAIQTTFKRLTHSFISKEHDVFAGKVKYTDYENEVIPEGNVFNRFLNKRKSFEHEKEVRAMILHANNDGDESGTYVDVDLNTLIQKVYLSPYSKKWFADLVRSTIDKYEIKTEVMNSNLVDKPFF